jgi:hypothetical protein
VKEWESFEDPLNDLSPARMEIPFLNPLAELATNLAVIPVAFSVLWRILRTSTP